MEGLGGKNRIRLWPSLILFLAMSRKRIQGRLVPLWARNRALHYLAGSYELSTELRHQLIQIVYGYAGRCDEEAARAGIKWLREKDREIGEIESLLWGSFARKYFPAVHEEDEGR
jgi:hypothetical protein